MSESELLTALREVTRRLVLANTYAQLDEVVTDQIAPLLGAAAGNLTVTSAPTEPAGFSSDQAAEAPHAIPHKAVLPLRQGTRVVGELTLHFSADGDGDGAPVERRLTDIIKNLCAQAVLRVGERERALQFAEQLAPLLGHDLRNPLSAILTAASLLEVRAESERVVRPVGRIRASAERMDHMISQLLDFAHVRIGRGLPIDCTEVDLIDVVRAALVELVPATRGLRLEQIDETSGAWDATRLAQVVQTLVGNAYQHGEPPIVVRVDGSRAGEVELHVSNQGAVAPEQEASFFEPHPAGTQSSQRVSPSGAGLGLFLARQIALAHGGQVCLEPGDGQRTSVSVRLPRRLADEPTGDPPDREPA